MCQAEGSPWGVHAAQNGRILRHARGVAGLAMAEAERVITAAYDLGALSDGTGIPGFYVRRGWPTSSPLDPDGPITCDWRPGDVW